jgi:hypothetical protein
MSRKKYYVNSFPQEAPFSCKTGNYVKITLSLSPSFTILR